MAEASIAALSIIGCGLDPRRHLTRQAEQAIQNQRTNLTLMPLSWVDRLGPLTTEIRSLFDDVYIQGIERQAAYLRAVQVVVDELAAGGRVGFLVAGGPVWFDSVVQLLLEEARRMGAEVELIAGISSPEAVLTAIRAPVAPDLLVTDARSILARRRTLDAATPTLILQPHVGLTRSVATAMRTAHETVHALGDKLLTAYPATHTVWIVAVAGEWPTDRIHRVAISTIAENDPPLDLRGASLYIPAIEAAWPAT